MRMQKWRYKTLLMPARLWRLSSLDFGGIKMKRLLVAGIASAAFCGAPAFAADMPVKAPVYKAADPMFNWTGFYIGATAGYGWGESNHYIPNGVNRTDDFNIDGYTAGGTLGYNWQRDRWVAGIESDISASRLSGSVAANSGTFGCGVICSTSVNDFATLRGRLGYAFDRVLPYVTGGFAWADVKASIAGGAVAGSSTHWNSGWTIGGGVEYAIDPRWSAKLEYLHFDIDDFTYNPFPLRASSRFDVVRVGINYRFGDPSWGKSPVSAKY
jgi:outer membrane immunogenic protein